jgi:hypothetical protein
LFSNAVNPCFALKAERRCFTPIQNNNKLLVLTLHDVQINLLKVAYST